MRASVSSFGDTRNQLSACSAYDGPKRTVISRATSGEIGFCRASQPRRKCSIVSARPAGKEDMFPNYGVSRSTSWQCFPKTGGASARIAVHSAFASRKAKRAWTH